MPRHTPAERRKNIAFAGRRRKGARVLQGKRIRAEKVKRSRKQNVLDRLPSRGTVTRAGRAAGGLIKIGRGKRTLPSQASSTARSRALGQRGLTKRTSSTRGKVIASPKLLIRTRKPEKRRFAAR